VIGIRGPLLVSENAQRPGHPGRRVVAGVVARRWLQRAEEGDEVGLVLLGEADVEPVVVEVDDRVEVGGEAIVEVRKGAIENSSVVDALQPFQVLPRGRIPLRSARCR
jgi:hypothetical protein